MDESGLWTHERLAAFLGIDEQTLHKLNSQGRGPARYRVGRYNRYHPDDIQAWLQAQRIPAN